MSNNINSPMVPSPRPAALRIGAVNYLNSKPLIEGLAESASGSDVVLDYPSRLASGLAAGTLDVALIPSVSFLENANYEIVSDACVAACGAVMSVKLYCRVPPAEIRTLALDEGSRTSAALVRIMLNERYGITPAIASLPLGESTEATGADAILLIGDRAMHPTRERFVATWDLGERWHAWTGLPFVFAMWVCRKGARLGRVEEALTAARDRGVKRLEEIGRREAPRLGIPEQLAIDYLTKNLHFQLGSAERRGLRLFQELAQRLQLVPEGVDIGFRDCVAT